MPDMWMDVDAALSEVPVNILPLIDDTDFKTRETGIVFNQAGMDLVWNFVTTAGATTQTAVTPTAAGDYDWAHQGDGMYTIEIPAVGGADINNDTEGFGWFTGYCTGVLPWRGPCIGFRAVGLNNLLIDNAFSATRGLAGTALPDAAADAAGGLPISDLGGLDLDTQIGTDIDAILTDTAEIGAAGAGLTAVPWNAAWDAEVESEVDDALGGGTGTALTAIPWNAAWDAEVESEVDDALGAGTGTALTAIPWNAAWDAQVQSEVQDALEANDLDHLIEVTAGAEEPTDGSYLDQVMHAGAGQTFDATTDSLEALRDRGDAAWITAPNDPTAAAIADAVWDEAKAGHVAGGSFGEEVQAHALSAEIAALNDLSAADVNAQVVDVLTVDTFAQPGQENPPAVQTLKNMIAYLYKALRNKLTQTGAQASLYNDDDVTVDQKAAVADDGVTFTRGKMGTGP